jgi:glycosyltransferase involved in cell wall biosynthesis|tara:strand:+ start:218 stop:1345 length:1128 start_codon:yes stop_codon:yes gene_type:complete
MKIVHIITGLNNGGAEGVLYRICKNNFTNEHIVISLLNEGKYGPLLTKSNIKAYYLNIKFTIFPIIAFIKLIRLLYSEKPDIVQTWLPHADFLGGIAARLTGIKKIVWNIRYSSFKKEKSKFLTTWILKILAKLSWLIPSSIIVCAKRSIDIYAELGYCKEKMHYIPNGYDLSIFKPINEQEFFIKKKLKINFKTPLIGTVARFDPQKDHMHLLNALAILSAKNIDFFCILVGPDVNKDNLKLVSSIQKLKLADRVKLLGSFNNIPLIMNELDIHILPSAYGEGFPNVVAEAMACETPCIVTDVGDSSFIVGNTGWVTPPNNPNLLAKTIYAAISELGTDNWDLRRKDARLRIEKNFNIINIVESYNELWNKVKS